MNVGAVRHTLLSITVVLSGCGAINIEPDEKEKHREIISKGAVVLAGVTVAACLLIPKVRKTCADAIDLHGVKNRGKNLELEQHQLRKEISRLRENSEEVVARLGQNVTDLENQLKEMRGRQANFNGFAFETNTFEAISKIIHDLYEGVIIKKTLRNMEGSYTQQNGRNKAFEIDAIAISDEHVFIIEAKTKLKHKHVDTLVNLLENFPKFEFNDRGLKNELIGKKVYGGISFISDSKRPFDGIITTRVASKYARNEGRLLTISRLNTNRSAPTTLAKLRDFQKSGS